MHEETGPAYQYFCVTGMCVIAAVCYGIAHDQVTARVCVEYFTIGHPPVFGTDDPTLLGIGWGIIATWWVGLFLGVPLAVVARAGSRPKRSVGSLVLPVGWLLAVMAMFALASGLTGWLLARSGTIFLVGPIANELPTDRHAPFLADLWAHSASYLVGLVGGIFVMVYVWRSRESRSHSSRSGPAIRRQFTGREPGRASGGDRR
jgi:hypothetical protein